MEKRRMKDEQDLLDLALVGGQALSCLFSAAIFATLAALGLAVLLWLGS